MFNNQIRRFVPEFLGAIFVSVLIIVLSISIININILTSASAESISLSPSFGSGQLVVNETININRQSTIATPQESTDLAKEAIEESFESVSVPVSNTSPVGPESNETATGLPVRNLDIIAGAPPAEMSEDRIGVLEEGGLSQGGGFTDDLGFGGNQTQTLISMSEAFEIKNVEIPRNSTQLIGETSVAAKDNLVFYTGNTYAARSEDNGTNWQFVNPYADMKDFCCDQVVVFDSDHQLFVWYRQGESPKQPIVGDNRARVGISHDAITWTMYDFTATTLNPKWRHILIDYPQIVLGDNYLYITYNIFDKYKEPKNGAIMMRISLEDLSEFSSANSSSSYILIVLSLR